MLRGMLPRQPRGPCCGFECLPWLPSCVVPLSQLMVVYRRAFTHLPGLRAREQQHVPGGPPTRRLCGCDTGSALAAGCTQPPPKYLTRQPADPGQAAAAFQRDGSHHQAAAEHSWWTRMGGVGPPGSHKCLVTLPFCEQLILIPLLSSPRSHSKVFLFGSLLSAATPQYGRDPGFCAHLPHGDTLVMT